VSCIGTKSYVFHNSPLLLLDSDVTLSQAEWGFVYTGSVLLSAVDENGQYQVEKLGFGDIWYFPKGQAQTIQGLEDENEYLLDFDDGDFNSVG
jgi:oxalate decarboxylase